MKRITLYVEQDTWLTRLHPFSKLFYILTAVAVPLAGGALWMYGLMIAISLCFLIPLISPVVSSSLINTRERAIALEVRGFGSGEKKTFLRERRMEKRDHGFMACMAALVIISVVWRIIHVIY